jgi:hypothetical protein
MATLGLVLSIAGAIGVLPIVAGAIYWSQGYHRARRVLDFRRSVPIDIVLTTSAVGLSEHGAPVSRPLTGYGQVRGVANCARALAAHYPHKDIVIHLSGFIKNRLDRDLVCLGGPAKNEVSKNVLADLPQRYGLKELIFDDIGKNIKIVDMDQREIEERCFDPKLRDGMPSVDICLIVAFTRIKADGRTTRCMLCAGFTSYGTAAAAEYMFLDLPRLRLKRLNELLGRAYRPIKPVGDFIIVTRAQFSRGECTEIAPIYETVLKATR